MEYNPLNIEMAGCKSTIQKIAEERAKEMEEAFDSFDEAFDIALEEIIDECKYLMRGN